MLAATHTHTHTHTHDTEGYGKRQREKYTQGELANVFTKQTEFHHLLPFPAPPFDKSFQPIQPQVLYSTYHSDRSAGDYLLYMPGPVECVHVICERTLAHTH